MGVLMELLIVIASVVVAVAVVYFILRYVLGPIFKGIGTVLDRLLGFIGRTISDTFRLVGSVITTLVYMPIIAIMVMVGRWSSAKHFGSSLQSEIKLFGLTLYRLTLGNLLRAFCASGVVEGLGQRVPQAIADAPASDAPHNRSGQFDGYSIVGSLPGGGSGSKLYIAEPDAIRLAGFERNGHFTVDQVVIKSFSLRDGSSLPQIVRESRSLEAAKKLGLVLDHQLTPERFLYVMRYVPGQSLTAVTHQIHAASESSNPRGLDNVNLRRALGITSDLLRTLDAYHKGGLWHKDVKPDNIIVDGMRAHLVDFGLITPLRSALTLTTHGTEYFRDPEMVRQALKGVKVHEVDGVKFDIYGAGAVLYSIVENSFPAHGALSQISSRCPEALRWIVRRAMTDYDKRYSSAGDMLRDLETVRLAADPMAVKPGQLPSMRDAAAAGEAMEPLAVFEMPGVASVQAAASAVPPPIPMPIPAPAAAQAFRPQSPQANEPFNRAASPVKPSIRLKNWWTGEHELDGQSPAGAPAAAPEIFGARVHPGMRSSAREQIERARGRAAAARARIQDRLKNRRSINRSYSNNPNMGVILGVGGVLGLLFLGVFVPVVRMRSSPDMDPLSVVSSDGRGSPATDDPESDGGPDSPTSLASRDPVERVKDATAFVVVGLQKPLAADNAESIKTSLDALRRGGLLVRGDAPGLEVDRADLDLTADALNALGTATADNPASLVGVRKWMTEKNAADVLIWYTSTATKPGEKTPVLRQFIIEPDAAGDTEREARIAKVRKQIDRALGH